MTNHGTAPTPLPVPAALSREREALRAVLESAMFAKNPRLARLLEYICNKYFDGDTHSIKEYCIAADVFGRSPEFDQSTDSIVRVEAHRLRKKLRDFYKTEGNQERLEIVVTTGRYLPQFIERFPEPVVNEAPAVPHVPETPALRVVPQQPSKRWRLLGGAAALLAALIALVALNREVPKAINYSAAQASTAPTVSMPVQAAFPTGKEVRIRCGYTKPEFRDRGGNLWMGDRYFTGGFPTELPTQYVSRTRDPQLYLALRSGTFSYKIPLAPGTYELRLHFAETTYGPASTLSGGENSRVFDISMNGSPLLKQFDIVNDAGANTADVRVFKDVHPMQDGFLHLDFSGVLGLPIINAIEILPSTPHRLLPIRMVAQDNFYVDKAGQLWTPDNYFSGGALAADKLDVTGTSDPGLYAGERYGNFSYALPVDRGRYGLTIYFAEKYWGTQISQAGGAGSRVFDIFYNGVALARGLDIAREAPPGHALVKSWHGLQPNAQGKLVVSLVPDVNYASVDAVEVVDESN